MFPGDYLASTGLILTDGKILKKNYSTPNTTTQHKYDSKSAFLLRVKIKC